MQVNLRYLFFIYVKSFYLIISSCVAGYILLFFTNILNTLHTVQPLLYIHMHTNTIIHSHMYTRLTNAFILVPLIRGLFKIYKYNYFNARLVLFTQCSACRILGICFMFYICIYVYSLLFVSDCYISLCLIPSLIYIYFGFTYYVYLCKSD